MARVDPSVPITDAELDVLLRDGYNGHSQKQVIRYLRDTLQYHLDTGIEYTPVPALPGSYVNMGTPTSIQTALNLIATAVYDLQTLALKLRAGVNWSGATAYVLGDVAIDGGLSYLCVAAHTNHEPPNSTYWSAMGGSLVRHAAGVPAGAPNFAGGELPIAFDSTAVTGGMYFWDGAAWVKASTIP